MTTYFLKMIACSAIFYALYYFLFQKEKMLVFNRIYLLAGLTLSFFIPLIRVAVWFPATNVIQYQPYTNLSIAMNTQPSRQDYLSYTLAAISIIVSGVLLGRAVVNLLKIRRNSINGEAIILQGAKIILLDKEIVPYSFLGNIFLKKNDYLQGRVEMEVLEHELAHVRQKHSWDILFVEFLQIATWFNPALYLYKQAIKTNHELLADAAVVKKYNNAYSYQYILLYRAKGQAYESLASSFNFLTTKKRLIMLQKEFNKKHVAIRSLAVIPALALAIFIGCNTVEKKEDINNTSAQLNADTIAKIQNDTAVLEAKDSKLATPKIEVKRFAPPKIIKDLPEGPGATTEELLEYESIVKEMKGKENRNREIKGRSDKVFPIYEKMTIAQRSNASQLPPPPPPKVELKKLAPPKIVKDKEPQKIEEVTIEEVKPAEVPKRPAPPKL